MIAGIQKAIEDFFDSWTGDIHIENTSKHPKSDTWIHLDVEPVDATQLGYASCIAEEHLVYITCYARNKVQAAILADNVIAFFCLKKIAIDGTVTGSWRPVLKGPIYESSYFYKIAVSIKAVN